MKRGLLNPATDKKKHFWMGALIAFSFVCFFKYIGVPHFYIWGGMVGIAAGIGKEVKDKICGGRFDLGDANYTGMGAFCGMVLACLIILLER